MCHKIENHGIKQKMEKGYSLKKIKRTIMIKTGETIMEIPPKKYIKNTAKETPHSNNKIL